MQFQFRIRIQVIKISIRLPNYSNKAELSMFFLFSHIFKLKLDEQFRIRTFLFSFFSTVKIWLLNIFFLKFLVNILPLGSGSRKLKSRGSGSNAMLIKNYVNILNAESWVPDDSRLQCILAVSRHLNFSYKNKNIPVIY